MTFIPSIWQISSRGKGINYLLVVTEVGALTLAPKVQSLPATPHAQREPLSREDIHSPAATS